MQLGELDREVGRYVRSAKRHLAMMVAVYSSMFVWGVLAVGLRHTMVILFPVLVLFGLLIARHDLRVMREGRAARTPRARLEFLHRRAVARVRSNKGLRWTAPLVVSVTWLGEIIVRPHGNAIYWIGGTGVSVFLLIAAFRAHRALPASITRQSALEALLDRA